MRNNSKITYLWLLFLLFAIFQTNAQMTYKVKVAARVNNEVILRSDVQKNSKLYKISYEEALNMLIEDALLYAGAKIAVAEPTEEAILAAINEDKAFYAGRVHKEVKDITEQEFLNALLTNNVSMKTFREYKKRQLWITNYVDSIVDAENAKYYYPTEAEINKATQEHPELLLEGEGVAISMIMFTAFNREGERESALIMGEKLNLANECLERLKSGESFVNLVLQYSEDLITRNDPDNPGYAGVIAFDDPRAMKSFPKEVLDKLQVCDVGPVKEVFKTEAGYYIFNIEAKVPPTKLYGEEARLKVESYLKAEYKRDFNARTRQKLIAQLKKEFDVKIY